MRDAKRLYQHVDVALLRAAAAPLTETPEWWPDPSDISDCRTWLETMWSRVDLADAIRLSSPTLAERVDAIRAGSPMADKQVRRAALATARYLLRSIGRPTPFGMFAGVAPVALGHPTTVRWDGSHRCLARVNTVWLHDVITRAENCPKLLSHLSVQMTDLAVRRGGRLEIPHGPNRVSIRHTRAITAVQNIAATPIQFAALVDRLVAAFPDADPTTVRDMLTGLVRQGYLITSLRAPCTVTDPLTHVLDQLHAAGTDSLWGTSPETALAADLADIYTALCRHNDADPADQAALREMISRRMTDLSGNGRARLTGDLLLDCTVRLPHQVAREIEAAASALLRLTRHPAGEPAWRAYHAAFLDRYGQHTLVPLADVLDPDSGLGYPAGYPGSVLSPPAPATTDRDQRLLALAWDASATGSNEITLTDTQITELTGEDFDERHIPPHVELAARVHAPDLDALDRGQFTLTVAPARAAGTLTSRFTPLATGAGLADAYRALPAATQDALRVQLSFAPLYPNAENVCRVPAYLDHLLPLGEHRHRDQRPDTALTVNDLAVTATHDRLHLVSLSRRQVVEPQVFHALDLRKQPPLLARFLTQLPRGFSAGWYQFDWGPHADLPRLPRVRYRRTVLFPAQWRLTTADLPAQTSATHPWCEVFDRWRERWCCPAVVELRDADRTLRLRTDEAVHLELLRAHLTRHGQAVLTEVAPPEQCGWLGGHVHEIAFPLVTTRRPAPNPLRGQLPIITNMAGHLPGSPGAAWLSAKLFTHPERIGELVTEHLPGLIDAVTNGANAPSYWWLRYRSPHETDHLRLRIRTTPDDYPAYTSALGEWAQRMREAGVAGRLVLDTYYPEVGRYGDGAALDAAERVFAADSRVAAALLRTHSTLSSTAGSTALVVANMVGMVHDFFGDVTEAIDWLLGRPAPAAPMADRTVAERAVSLGVDVIAGRAAAGWPRELVQAWQHRAQALATYREQQPPEANRDRVLESLLHMHHNRAVGIDSQSERRCRRLARHTALAWRYRHTDGTRTPRAATR